MKTAVNSDKDAVSMEDFLKLMKGKALRVASDPRGYVEDLITQQQKISYSNKHQLPPSL